MGPNWRLAWHNIFKSIFLWKINLKELNSHIFLKNYLYISWIILFKEMSLHGSTDEILILFTPKLLYITPISIIPFTTSVARTFSCTSFVPACIITREGWSLWRVVNICAVVFRYILNFILLQVTFHMSYHLDLRLFFCIY